MTIMEAIERARFYKIPFTDGMVLLDWSMTILGAILVAKKINVSFVLVISILLLLSIGLHYLFGIDTVTNYYLGLSSKPQSASKIKPL